MDLEKKCDAGLFIQALASETEDIITDGNNNENFFIPKFKNFIHIIIF